MFSMYDTVDLTQVPAGATAVAGYVGGSWPTDSHDALRSKFPHAYVLSIAVNAGEVASFLDVESGDAVPNQAAPWLEQRIAAGQSRPGIYGSYSTMMTVIPLIAEARIPRQKYRLWLAAPNGLTFAAAVLEKNLYFDRALPEGFHFGAVQYDWHALGRDLDESLCRPGFFVPSHEYPLARETAK